MPSYQIDKLDADNKSATVIFTADDGTQITRAYDDLPLDDAEATKSELFNRLKDWQESLYSQESEEPSKPKKPVIDPALEDMLHRVQKHDTDKGGQVNE